MIPVALLLWRVVLKPLIDWWKGVPSTKKAVEGSQTEKEDGEKKAEESKPVSITEDQSELR